MQLKFESLSKLCLGALLALASMTTNASYQIVSVAGTAGPWTWVDGGLNTDYQYGSGAPDYTAPARLKLADIGIGEGDTIYINYIGGFTSAFGDIPDTNNNGYVGSNFKDDELGPGGLRLPSYYLGNEWGEVQNPANPGPYGVFLQSLIAVLTDDAGEIVQLFSMGTVFSDDDTGDQLFLVGRSFDIPANATYVQFGLNDDIFSNNTGALEVYVGSQDVEPVPVPGAVWLFASGMVGLLTVRRTYRS
jgi:hypothetical protein